MENLQEVTTNSEVLDKSFIDRLPDKEFLEFLKNRFGQNKPQSTNSEPISEEEFIQHLRERYVNEKPKSINLEPLNNFFTEELSPTEFAEILDEFLFEYIDNLIHLLYSDGENIHLNTHQFIYYVKTLRDVLPKCETT